MMYVWMQYHILNVDLGRGLCQTLRSDLTLCTLIQMPGSRAFCSWHGAGRLKAEQDGVRATRAAQVGWHVANRIRPKWTGANLCLTTSLRAAKSKWCSSALWFDTTRPAPLESAREQQAEDAYPTTRLMD